MRRVLLPLLIVAFAIAGGTAGFLLGGRFYDNPPAPAGVAQYDIGDTVSSDAAFVDAQGTPRTLDEWRGRLLIVNYWASWCPPCIEEMPLLDRFADENAAAGVTIIGIAEDDPDAVDDFLARHPVGYPILLGGGPGGLPSIRVGNSRNVLPYTVLIGPDGALLERRAGLVDAALLSGWVRRHGR